MADPHAVTRWAVSARRVSLLSNLFSFLTVSGWCPDLTELEHRGPCEFLESLIPDKNVWVQKQGIWLDPRLTFKSSIMTGFIAYVMLKYPDYRIVLGRATSTLAEQSLAGIKTNLESNDILTACFGNLRSRFSDWTKSAITLGDRSAGFREPTVMTTALNQSQTGQHPDIVILDDIINEQNYLSPVSMTAARLLVQSFYPVVERWGSFLLVGTRWGDNDVYGWAMDEDEKQFEKTGKRNWRTFIRGAYDSEGNENFPTVLPRIRLDDLASKIEPKMFSAWYLNEAREESEKIFSPAYIRYFKGTFTEGMLPEITLDEGEPLIKSFGPRITLNVVMTIDTAPTVGPKSDFTGIVVTGFDADSNWWVMSAHEIKMLPTDRINYIVNLARKFHPRTIAIENADMDAPLLKEKLQSLNIASNVVSFNPKLDRARITAIPGLAPRGATKKEAQIESLEPKLRAGEIFFMVGTTAPLTRQMIAYPYVDHDDVIDAFSMTKAYELKAVQDIVNIDYVALGEAAEQREYDLEFGDEDEPHVRRGGIAGLSSARRK